MAEKLEQLNVDLTIKQVSSDDVLKDMEENNQLDANQIIVTETDTEVPMMPVGSIFASAIPITDARVHLLDGSTISQTGVYETFANLIKALDASGQPITCIQTEFDADVTATGNCGKFVIDNTAGTIRLPKITTFIQGLNDITNIGSSLSAGLPNITGNIIGVDQTVPPPSSTDGALGVKRKTVNRYVTLGGSSAERDGADVTFDASKSNAIYGKSSTVQPRATQYPYYIVLASGYKSSQVVDFDNIMNEVNAKLPLTGGTMTGVLDINNPSNDTKGINIKNADSSAMMSFIRTDNGNAISVGIGSGGVNRGVYDEKLGYWLMHTDGTKLKLKAPSTRPTYNDKDLALYSDAQNMGGILVSQGLGGGTRYFPLVRFNKSLNDGNNSASVFVNGKIGGYGAGSTAYIDAIFWGRDKRGGEYTSIGNIKSALGATDFVMYEESSTSVVLYLKINGYSSNRFTFKMMGDGIANLYDGSYITSTPTGTLIASMTNGTISEKKDADVLYDMSSSSSSINWGKTAGIQGGVSVSGKDFSKYSFLRVTAFSYDTKFTYFIDLKKAGAKVWDSSYPYIGNGGLAMSPTSPMEEHYSLSCVNSAKTTFYHYKAGYVRVSDHTNNERNSNGSYYITKIEGVV